MGEELRHGLSPRKMYQAASHQKQELRKVLDFDYELHKQTLATVTSAKYLGITVHKKISWDNHIE